MLRTTAVLAGWFCVLCVGRPFPQRLIVVLLDGVRWDYIQRDPDLRGFARIAREGVKVKHVVPIFPSMSYPNWYTIATGLYAESHGIVDNHMYDVQRNDSFLMGPHPNVSHEHWWNKTEPIWINAERHGKRTAMHYWDGCQVPNNGILPMQCEPYRNYWEWIGARQEIQGKMAEVLEWFEELESHQLAMIYYEGPDAYGHKYGPDSEETRQEMRDTDKILDVFQDKIEASRIKDQINLVVLSDHGMTDVEMSERIVLDTLSGHQDIALALGGGAEANLLPAAGKNDQLADALKSNRIAGLRVYRKENIPEYYHIKNGQLTMPVVIEAELGHIILMPNQTSFNKGTHGYNPYVVESDGTNQMNTVMYARGPAFKRGFFGRAIHQTDHYNIFCYILGLTPHPNNGSWYRVKDLLVNDAEHSSPVYFLMLILIVTSLFFARLL